MKTKATKLYPEIDWNQKTLMDSDVDERSETWEVYGVDGDGNKYIGTGEYSCGELIRVLDIEPDL